MTIMKVHSFIRSFDGSSVRLFVRSFVHSFFSFLESMSIAKMTEKCWINGVPYSFENSDHILVFEIS